MLSRRTFLTTGTLAAASAATPLHRLLAATPRKRFAGLAASLSQLEKETPSRLGVAVMDTSSGEIMGHRLAERFAMCSTFKLLLNASVLHRVDTGKETLDRLVQIPAKQDLVSYSPVTQEHAGSTMPIRDLCAASMTRSDNSASNLLLASLGGPPAIGQFARSLGDSITRLDRIETALNDATPGDPRDTSSPAAMAANLHKLALGDKLLPASRNLLTGWLIQNTTGTERLRAGLPKDWRIGDKTGSNGETTSNDIAVVWPTNQTPVIVAVYLTECPGPETKRSAIIAQVGHLVAEIIQSA